MCIRDSERSGAEERTSLRRAADQVPRDRSRVRQHFVLRRLEVGERVALDRGFLSELLAQLVRHLLRSDLHASEVGSDLHRGGPHVASAVGHEGQAGFGVSVRSPVTKQSKNGRSTRNRWPIVKELLTVPARATCLLYTSPSPRDATLSRMPSSA